MTIWKTFIKGKNKNLFVYGSLLKRSEAIKVISEDSWGKVTPAILEGYRRIYNKWSKKWGGCVLNIEPSETHAVIGLLFLSLDDDELEKVAEREAWGSHYKSMLVNVETLVENRKYVVLTSIEKKNIMKGRISSKYQEVVNDAINQLDDQFSWIELAENYNNNTFDSENRKVRLL